MIRAIIICILCLVCAADVTADGISNPTTQFVGNMGEGINNGGHAGGGGGGCVGAANFADGCAIAVFGH